MSIDWQGIEAIDFQLDLQFFDDHCRFIDTVLEKEQEECQIRFKKIKANLINKKTRRATEDYETEAYYIMEVFPSIQWSAMFVATYNLFEKNLNDICNCIKGITGATSGFKDSTGRGIERAKNYLSKVHNITAPFSSREWNKIRNLTKIRNVLCHTNGELDLSIDLHRKVFELVKKEKENKIYITNHDPGFQSAVVIVEKEFVYDAVKTYLQFLKLLILSIKKC